MSLQSIRDWFEDLEIRKKLEDNQPIAIIGLLVVIVLCLSVAFCQLVGGGGRGTAQRPVKLVYLDFEKQTVRLVDHQYSATSPPSSPLAGTEDVYIVSVYRCETCPKGTIKKGMTLDELKASGMFIGSVERVNAGKMTEMTPYKSGMRSSDLSKATWYEPLSEGHEKMMADLYERCPSARICLPE